MYFESVALFRFLVRLESKGQCQYCVPHNGIILYNNNYYLIFTLPE